MSELSYLEKLLDGVEVEWLSLGELAFIRGNGLQKKISLKVVFQQYITVRFIHMLNLRPN
jgi:hypothetical protein